MDLSYYFLETKHSGIQGAIVSIVDKATTVTMLGLVSTGTADFVSEMLIK